MEARLLIYMYYLEERSLIGMKGLGFGHDPDCQTIEWQLLSRLSSTLSSVNIGQCKHLETDGNSILM